MKAMPVVDIKSHFSAVLAEVAKGEEIAITRHGRVVARLVPPLPTPPLMAAEVFRPYWHEGQIDLEAPADPLPTPVPSLD
ncbi:MAG: hypothetical protein QG616_1944 [Pseudomonadota bacterium]|jgi:prevent-host-death family protein|nr:hypothetical protein [Pseudomonadota bacterium]MDQ5882112.1 hypothetical protein [Pseudomonadota bacterium]MDQ5905352.1 hypothetical protein [Pseudomonadota bacterium]MDQ5914128.1 hypothetical protein [Pseudomonadota bacterium]MDQ5916941.1 hypothetical protein [Pseudomonadota bacterium]